MEQKVHEFTDVILNNTVISKQMEDISKLCLKPLRALQYYNPSKIELTADIVKDLPYYPVICVSASRIQSDSDTTYIQGAGDDEESWAMNLKPSLFWKYKDVIMESEDDAQSVVEDIVRENKEFHPQSIDKQETENLQQIRYIGNTGIAIAKSEDILEEKCWDHFDVIVNCIEESKKLPTEGTNNNNRLHIHLPMENGKVDKYQISRSLPSLLRAIYPRYKNQVKPTQILIHSFQGMSSIFYLTCD
eukprot:TRINITY_DN3527_c0_g1_i4.p1 TRINITY_DN3527_c0_g1~~TRINITY_DN3527_c0_g1_i4.p1  ORF type:complete len:246 (-),score=50.43 TRINITY_DN3527_c0_g1_i4:647-1384(-)